MKAISHSIMIVLAGTLWPISAIVLVYSIGAAILLGQWQLMIGSAIVFTLSIFIIIGLGLLTE